MSDLKDKIKELVSEYIASKPDTWVAGEDWIKYSGPHYDEKEYIAAIDVLVDGWLIFGENARVKAAGMRERIEGLRSRAENSTGVLHNIYVLEMQKLEAKLVELEQMAGEEEEAAQAASITKMALAIAAVVGVVAVAGFAITQVQKARLLQVKIKKTQTGR